MQFCLISLEFGRVVVNFSGIKANHCSSALSPGKICLTTTKIMFKKLSVMTKYDPILFQNRYLSFSISVKARGFLKINRYIRPGIVKEVIESPKAPTNSKTVPRL